MQTKAVDHRIAELEKEEKALSQQIADENPVCTERFNKLKIDTGSKDQSEIQI
jgi:hypothetical protein